MAALELWVRGFLVGLHGGTGTRETKPYGTHETNCTYLMVAKVEEI
jgi:hypothetical protein